MVMDNLTEFMRPKRRMQAGDEMLRGRISRDKIIACFVERHLNGDPPPTYQDLMEVTEVYSTSSIYHHVQRLKEKGVLVKWGISYWLAKPWIAENLTPAVVEEPSDEQSV